MRKTIFEADVRAEVIERMCQLTPSSKAQWGSMTVSQMVRHCSSCEEYYQGQFTLGRSWVGRLFGAMAIRNLLKQETNVMGRNAPTASRFRVTATNLDLQTEIAQRRLLIEGYGTYQPQNFVHWFFGRMTLETLGQFIYMHCDHHLRQFGV